MSKPSVWKAIFEKDERPAVKKADRKAKFFTREISGSFTQGMKHLHSRRLLRLSHAISELISHISTRIYGTMLLCFALLSSLIYFLGISADGSIATPIIGILLAGISIPFLLTDKPLPIFLQDFGPTDYIFFEFFCMKRHSTVEKTKSFPVAVAIVAGVLPALVTVFIPMWQVTLAIIILICIYIGMASPEFIFLSSLLCLPYIRFIPYSEIVFSLAILLALISFARKVAYGRRVLYIEQYDILMGIMLLFILISGIFVKGLESFVGSIKMIVFAMGYILAGNIITNRRLAELSANSIIISGVAASLVSIGQVIATLVKLGASINQDSVNFVLARQEGVAVSLMASLVFAIGMIGDTKGVKRALAVISALVCFIALFISGEIMAITSLIIAVGAFFVMRHNKLPGLFLPILLAISVAVLLLPDSFLNIIFASSPSVISAEDLFELWHKSLQVMSHHLAIGIGIGSESFGQEMAAVGVVGHPNSSNLFIELGLEAGILAPLCLIILLITRVNHRSMQYLYVRNSQIEKISILSGACLFSLLAFGMVNYIWSDASACYLFWCIFGIGSASLRVAKRDYDDRVIYYEESSAQDSSVIDIEIG